ncbi:MAG: metallophosphoesterase [Microbacter sp.]
MHKKRKIQTIFPFIFLAIIGYVTWDGFRLLSNHPLFQTIYVTLNILFFLFFMLALFVGHHLPIRLASLIAFVGNTYLIAALYLFLLFLLTDVVLLLNSLIHFIPGYVLGYHFDWIIIDFVLIAMVLLIGNYRFNHPKTVILNLESNKPKQQKTLKIVAVSDIHLGFSIKKEKLQRYVAMINQTKPDLILMIGDVSDRSMQPIIEQNMVEELSQLKATFGVYAINGNHEHYAETPEATSTYLKTAGIHVLIDETACIDQSFYLIGRDDKSNIKRQPLASLVKGLDPTLPKILLDHQPYQLQEAQHNDIDLQLSGHTHEGQFFPGNLFVKKIFEIQYGYRKIGNTHYYVSSGLGIWGPQYRIGTQSEMVVIHFNY